MTDTSPVHEEVRLPYRRPALESLGSLVELTKTDQVQNATGDGAGYAPGQPGGS